MLEEFITDIDEESTIFYVNDSYNLVDAIPFNVHEIIDTDDNIL
jgi:hypothetical protein